MEGWTNIREAMFENGTIPLKNNLGKVEELNMERGKKLFSILFVKKNYSQERMRSFQIAMMLMELPMALSGCTLCTRLEKIFFCESLMIDISYYL